ncbi:hypothetical protein ACYZUD_31525 [Pseudomonas sp. XS1P51]
MTQDSNTFTYRRLTAAPCNKIIILKSLRPDDPDTADYIRNHIAGSISSERVRQGELGAIPTLIELNSKHHLISLLKEIKEECLKGTSPIIHLETHGCRDHGLAIFSPANGVEIITWEELILLFREINTACRGNLMVILAACHSYQIEEYISVQSPSPFFALIGYDNKIEPHDIESDLAFLYDSLLLEHTLPSPLDNPFEKYTLYTEYDLGLALITVTLMNITSPSMVKHLMPTFDQLLEEPNPLSHLPLHVQKTIFDTLVKSEVFIRALADIFMQNKQNVQVLKQDISKHFQTWITASQR